MLGIAWSYEFGTLISPLRYSDHSSSEINSSKKEISGKICIILKMHYFKDSKSKDDDFNQTRVFYTGDSVNMQGNSQGKWLKDQAFSYKS